MKNMMKRPLTSRRSSPKPPVVRARVRPRRTRADRETAEHLLALLKSGGDLRLSKIKRVRQKVKARSYENDLKLSIAIERVISDGVLAQFPA